MDSTHATKSSHNNSYWNRFYHSQWNPNNWDFTAKKVATVAAIILILSIGITFISALLVQFPNAAGAFLGIFGILALASLVVMTVGIVKHNKDQPHRKMESIYKDAIDGERR